MRRGFGVFLDKLQLNEETIVAGLEQILHNESYREAAKKASIILNRMTEDPAKTFVKWIELAGEFKDLRFLNLAGNDLNFAQYFLLDIIIPGVLFVILMVVLVFYALLKFVRKCCCKKKVKSE